MLVNYKKNEYKALLVTGKNFIIFLLYAIAIGFLDHYFHFEVYHPNTTTLTILGSGVGIFLAFRINSGYGRWWEARKIWGELVNDSRTFGNSVTAMLTNHTFDEMTSDEKSFQKEIIYNFIAYINALRIHLRKQGEEVWEREIWTREINGKRILSQDDEAMLKTKANKPAQLLHMISQKVAKFYNGANNREFRFLHFMDLITVFNNVQGKCERIKNTVFPWGYAYYTKRLVWLLAFLIPLGLLRGLDWPDILVCAIVSTVFVTVEQVGRNLDNPFENSFNDTPMTTLCRVIEIDLLQQIGESEVPEPIHPVDGILY